MPRPVRLHGNQELCSKCVNAEGCPLRELLTKPIKECAEFDHAADIIGPIPSLKELEELC